MRLNHRREVVCVEIIELYARILEVHFVRQRQEFLGRSAVGVSPNFVVRFVRRYHYRVARASFDNSQIISGRQVFARSGRISPSAVISHSLLEDRRFGHTRRIIRIPRIQGKGARTAAHVAQLIECRGSVEFQCNGAAAQIVRVFTPMCVVGIIGNSIPPARLIIHMRFALELHRSRTQEPRIHRSVAVLHERNVSAEIGLFVDRVLDQFRSAGLRNRNRYGFASFRIDRDRPDAFAAPVAGQNLELKHHVVHRFTQHRDNPLLRVVADRIVVRHVHREFDFDHRIARFHVIGVLFNHGSDRGRLVNPHGFGLFSAGENQRSLAGKLVGSVRAGDKSQFIFTETTRGIADLHPLVSGSFRILDLYSPIARRLDHPVIPSTVDGNFPGGRIEHE